MRQLLTDLAEEYLEVKTEPLHANDFTFDQLPPYPSRDDRLTMLKDLMLAFGNPFLHHQDPQRQYLASDSQPVSIRVDDILGNITPPFSELGFRGTMISSKRIAGL